MSSLAFLVTELQSLASETRRKHPDVREAAEKAIAILKAAPESASFTLDADGPHANDLLRPVFMGCATKNAKVIGIALGPLQRLIALHAVPLSAVPAIISTMGDCMAQGVDIQLKLLQTLLSLITNFPDVHGRLLGDALLLCFKLQESRIAVVSSTAAATLRQLVMFVVDKVVDEDRRVAEADEQDSVIERTDTPLPDGSSAALGPAARDAFAVFEDLCLLANAERPHLLKLEALPKTFALELIESVLTNYHDLFRKHPELLLLLRHHLCPMLHKALSDRPLFPLTLRSTRVVFLLLKQFATELITEAEVFLTLLIRIISGESDVGATATERPPWMRVLAMEILRGLCSDAEFVRATWQRYDAQNTAESGSQVFVGLVTALKRLITERPAVLGVSAQMLGTGGAPDSPGYMLDVGGVAGMVATAASATVSNVVGMMGPEAGLSIAGSSMKVQCIDQLDKADAPPIPESYIYLLGLQCIVALCEGFVTYTAPIYSALTIQKPRAAGDAAVRAPPALDPSTLPESESARAGLIAVRSMVSAGWPALLAALAFLLPTNLSDELFAAVLAAAQALTTVAGTLALPTPRDAFLTALAKAALPPRVVAGLETHVDPATPRAGAAFADSAAVPPMLSERNVACLKVLVGCALYLAGSLGESWFDVLEALQNADYVLTNRGTRAPAGKRGSVVAQRSASASAPPAPRHPLLCDLEPESVLSAMQRLFDASKNLEDGAFRDFVGALCRLSGEMVGMQAQAQAPQGEGLGLEVEGADEASVKGSVTSLSSTLSPTKSEASRRRASGIHLPRTLRSGDFGINRIGRVAVLNIHRLIYRSPDIAWDPVTSHLLSVIRLPTAPQPIRLQAAQTLDDILLVVPRNLTTAGDRLASVQSQMLNVLSQQIMLDSASSNATIELRRMGLETLHQILQASGHTLVVGWETIFDMLSSVCKPAVLPPPLPSESASPVSSTARPRVTPLGLGHPSEKGYTTLIKIAFQSMTLVCDSLSALSPEHLRMCISTLGHFGRQADTNIALTAAESLLWSVSDSIQAKRKDAEKEPEYSELWMFLLLEILRLCTDVRPEVRMGAIQTLFRTLQLYGATLSASTWDECIWKVTFPLLDALGTAALQNPAPPSVDLAPVSQSWDESRVVAFQSVGAIFTDFLVSKVLHLESFARAWDVFVDHIRDAFVHGSRTISAPALRCLEKALRALRTGITDAGTDVKEKEKVLDAAEKAWSACDEMGDVVLKATNASTAKTQPFTQESLVAFMNVVQGIRGLSRTLKEEEWSLDRIARLLVILKGILTYSHSPDIRPDVDNLSPLQTEVMSTIGDLVLDADGAPSLVLKEISELANLSFSAASHDSDPVSGRLLGADASKPSPKRVTYVALMKKCQPLLVDLFVQFKDRVEIYVNGTLEAVLWAYSIPIKMKYECPPASKFGKDPPLWKSATSNFLNIVKHIAPQLDKLDADIPGDRVEAIWRQTIDVFRGGILADCTFAESQPFELQEEEETFDLTLIASLETDVVPYLGDRRISDHVITQLVKVLQQGSQLREYEPEEEYSHSPVSPTKTPTDGRRNAWTHSEENADIGSTEPGAIVSRERFSYWCFDLLFLICSDTFQDHVDSRKRVAVLSLSLLLGRCRQTLAQYVADENVRGALPFPRVREEELVYVLHKLRELRVWPGSLWAALSDSPSDYVTEQPVINTNLTPSELIADTVKRSSRAHLFHLYSVIGQIASVPRKAPSAWVMSDSLLSPPATPNSSSSSSMEIKSKVAAGGLGSGRLVSMDSRALARECLKEIGREMGVPP